MPPNMNKKKLYKSFAQHGTVFWKENADGNAIPINGIS